MWILGGDTNGRIAERGVQACASTIWSDLQDGQRSANDNNGNKEDTTGLAQGRAKEGHEYWKSLPMPGHLSKSASHGK